jgi:hypothetical protein
LLRYSPAKKERKTTTQKHLKALFASSTFNFSYPVFSNTLNIPKILLLILTKKADISILP